MLKRTNKVAIVTGCPGQAASYLCELLLSKDYIVYGVQRRSMRENDNMIECEGYSHYVCQIMDICDVSGMRNLVRDIKPDEFYNLAAMSHVGQSFEEPLATMQTDAVAVLGMLEAIRHEAPNCRFYQASTSEMFGKNGIYITSNGHQCGKSDKTAKLIQWEDTPLSPRSPYAVAKVAAHNSVNLYRMAYGLHASCGISFNHESPRRGKDFVTRKITDAMVRIKLNLCHTVDHITSDGKILLGNLDAYRDFGHAKDYVKAMWLMLQQDEPDDYVIATGRGASIRDVLDYVAHKIGHTWKEVYMKDERYMRPSDVPYLCGDATKAKEQLGWVPEYTWETMLDEMFDADWNRCVREGLAEADCHERYAADAQNELLPK